MLSFVEKDDSYHFFNKYFYVLKNYQHLHNLLIYLLEQLTNNEYLCPVCLQILYHSLKEVTTNRQTF